MTRVTNAITRYIPTYEFTLKTDLAFHFLESEYNKAKVIERASRIFKC
jgi:hypothetical protein